MDIIRLLEASLVENDTRVEEFRAQSDAIKALLNADFDEEEPLPKPATTPHPSRFLRNLAVALTLVALTFAVFVLANLAFR